MGNCANRVHSVVVSHLSVSVTPSQAGAASPGLSSPSAGSKASGTGFTSLLDALHVIEAAATGNIAGVAKALTQPKEATAPATPGLVHIDAGATGAALSSTANATVETAATDASNGAATLLDAVRKLLPGAAKADADGTVSVPLDATATPDPIVPPDPTTTSDAGTPPKLVKDLIAALSDLQKAEQSGKPIDKDLQKRVKDAIDALSNFLAAQQQPPVQAVPIATATPVPTGTEPVTAVAAAATGPVAVPDATATAPVSGNVADNAAATSVPADGKQSDALKAARTELGSFTDKLETLSATLTKDQPDLAAKLDTLAKSLDPKTLSAATLGALGLDAGSPAADPKVAAAINGFVNGKVNAPVTLQPVLAKPALKLPDGTALADTSDKPRTTGIAHKAAATPDTAPAKTVPSAANDSKPGNALKPPDDDKSKATTTAPAPVSDKPADAKAADAKPNAASAAAGTATTPPAAAPTLQPAGMRQVQDAYQAAAPAPVNLPQMAFEIARHAQQGISHFQIRLDPADMGRVDVKLAIDSTGQVNAHLTVERSETLDLLKRDSGSLGQALVQAGLDGSKTNLQFSLSQNPFGRQQGGGSAYVPPVLANGEAGAGETAALPAVTSTLYRGTATASGLNIFV